jgi:RND family efflux transporter MFP subunit
MKPEGRVSTAMHEAAPEHGSASDSVRWFLLVPLILLILGTLMFLSRGRQSKALAATTRTLDVEAVSVTHAQAGKPDNELTLPSTLQAYIDSPIYARTSGYIAHWYVDIGTHVHQGQLLATISSPEVDQELSQALAQLAQTQANLSLAAITAKRYQDLIGSNAVAQQEVDQNNQGLSAQQAAVQAANANVKRLQELQSFEQILAPFDGVITQRLTDIGNLINAGNGGTGTQLFRLSKIDVIRIFVPVPEIYSDQVKTALAVSLDQVQLPGKTFHGSVVRTSHAIDPASHTMLIEVDIPNPSGELLPGAYANVHLQLKTPVPPLVIPTGAVLFQASGPQVAIVNNNQVELRKVSIGRDFGNTIEITAGISPSDQVITSPPDYLVDGMKVITQQPRAGQ